MDCNEIIPDRLWIGAYVRPQEAGRLKELGITTVVNLQSDQDLADRGVTEAASLRAYTNLGIEMMRAPTPDFDIRAMAQNLESCLEKLETALEPRWSRVYLHCTAGINRAPTVAAAFLMRSRGMGPQAAWDYVRSRRHCSPYLEVLEDYATGRVK